MQSRRISDQGTKSMFVDLQNRIKTMELIHTNLYTTAQFNKIMMKEYLSLLVKHLSNSFASNETVMFSIQCEEVSMDIDQAITCGQIINELVTNAYKHAFKDMDDGHIWIRIIDSGEHFELQIEDNGNGGGNELTAKQFSLGLSLVHELTRYQLKGTVKVSSKKGLKYQIVFRKKQF
jgi:two-component sensor histidine kinase